MQDIEIRRAALQDLDAVSALAVELWPEHTAAELAAEFREGIETEHMAFFLALDGDKAVGFIQCALRRDYVEGSESSPVGYIEGIYVRPEWQASGIGRALVGTAENWALAQDCQQLGSDCLLKNTGSAAFHRAVGFAEAAKIVCFIKNL